MNKQQAKKEDQDAKLDTGLDKDSISCSSKGTLKRELSEGEHSDSDEDDSHSDYSGKRRRSDFDRSTKILNYSPIDTKAKRKLKILKHFNALL
jgi:hypothetical protein